MLLGLTIGSVLNRLIASFLQCGNRRFGFTRFGPMAGGHFRMGLSYDWELLINGLCDDQMQFPATASAS